MLKFTLRYMKIVSKLLMTITLHAHEAHTRQKNLKFKVQRVRIGMVLGNLTNYITITLTKRDLYFYLLDLEEH